MSTFRTAPFPTVTTATSAAAAAKPVGTSGMARGPLPLPRGLRAEAEQMTTTRFWSTYAPSSGPIELGSWSASDATGGRRRYDLAVAIRGATQTCTTRAYGPVEAMTESLHRAGLPIEIGEFHHQKTEVGYTAYLTCRHHDRTVWAAGAGRDGVEATLRAMIAGANRLHGSRL